MEDKDFDQFIRDNLNGAEDAWTSGNWELFEQKLDNQLPNSDMGTEEEEAFDDLLSEKMQQFHAEFEPGHWALMSNRIDAEWPKADLEEVYLDGVAYENLTNLKSSYDPNHWTLMSQKLDVEYSLRRKLYKYKITELALMLLVIFTLLQYIPFKKTSNALVITDTNLPAVALEETESIILKSIVEEAETATSQESNLATASLAQENTNTSQANSHIIANANTTTVSSDSKEELTVISNQISTHNSITERVAGTSNTIAERHPAPQEGWQTLNALPNKATAASYSSTGLVPTEFTKHKLLKASPTIATLLANAKEGKYALPKCTSCTKLPSRTRLRIGMFATMDANYIMTPYNISNLLPSYDKFFLGYGGGLSVSFQYNRWEIETGGIFSSIYYTPKEYRIAISGEFEEGFSSIGFKDAQIELLRIPINMRYAFIQKSRWHVYAMTGATANAAIYVNYNVQSEFPGPERDQSFLPPKLAPPDSGNEIQVQEEKARYKGSLENGGLQNNLYFSANIGLGVERFMTHRWSIFVHPLYHHSLNGKGFGPNADRFNHISTYFGIRAKLK